MWLSKLLCTKGISFFLRPNCLKKEKKHSNHKSFAESIREDIRIVMAQVGEPEGYTRVSSFY